MRTHIARMVDYDAVMAGDWDHRVTAFNKLSAEEQAELVRMHFQRWLRLNEARLSPEQISLIHEQIAFITADLYRRPTPEPLLQASKEIEARAAALFERADRYALTLHGGYLPGSATFEKSTDIP